MRIPDLGANFTGTVVNSTDARQEQLIVQAIVRKAGEVVAAGTAVVEGLDPEPVGRVHRASSSATRPAASWR